MGWLFCNVLWVNIAHEQRESPVMSALKWRGRKAAEPNDNVFGLLGLLPTGMELAHTGVCGYDTPTVELFSAFTLDLILYDEGLLLLAVEPRAPAEKGTKGLARWAYDMDCEIPHLVDQFYRYWGWSSYDACAGRDLDKEALRSENPAGSMSLRMLRLTGVMVDTVTLTGTSILKLRAGLSDRDRRGRAYCSDHAVVDDHCARISREPGGWTGGSAV